MKITVAFPFLKEASGFWQRSLWLSRSPGLAQTSEQWFPSHDGGMLLHWAVLAALGVHMSLVDLIATHFILWVLC